MELYIHKLHFPSQLIRPKGSFGQVLKEAVKRIKSEPRRIKKLAGLYLPYGYEEKGLYTPYLFLSLLYNKSHHYLAVATYRELERVGKPEAFFSLPRSKAVGMAHRHSPRVRNALSYAKEGKFPQSLAKALKVETAAPLEVISGEEAFLRSLFFWILHVESIIRYILTLPHREERVAEMLDLKPPFYMTEREAEKYIGVFEEALVRAKKVTGSKVTIKALFPYGPSTHSLSL